MQAIKDIYRIGNGPSSSHTIAPKRAAELFVKEYGLLDHYIIELYGSLSLTGKGHKTDEIINKVLDNRCSFVFDHEFDEERNIMIFNGYNENDELVAKWHVESLGGGAIRIDEYETDDEKEIYKENSFDEIKLYISENQLSLIDYIKMHENDIIDYLENVIDAMVKSVDNGLESEGIISEKLNVYRSAKEILIEGIMANDNDLKLMSYAYAAGEENAMGHVVVTAPTLGSCGIIASVVYHSLKNLQYPKEKIAEALAVGGLFGNIIKHNATISGALGGCQAEVGTACSMASAMIAYLDDANIKTIEYAAEIGIEHHLGLTCDPVYGLVIIPCIERNAMAVLRSYDAYKLSKYKLRVKDHLVTFDMVVSSMRYTGKKISPELKETGKGGLALEFNNEKD